MATNIKRKALIEVATGRVKNVILAGDDFAAPAGHTLLDSESASPGDLWDGVKFTPAPVIAPPPQPVEVIEDRVDALEGAAGETVIGESTTVKVTSSLSAVKLKEMRIWRGGTVRVAVTLSGAPGGVAGVQAQVYRNGVPVGTLRDALPLADTVYSEDIGGWYPGDLCQVWGKVADAIQVLGVKTFQVKSNAGNNNAQIILE